MANTLVQIRVDEKLKNQATAICEELGIDLPTAVRIFMKRTVAEGGIPFDMKVIRKPYRSPEGWALVEAMGKEAETNGVADLSLDEINAEINDTRAERSSDKAGA